ncbi:MAG: dihydrolipoamide acetyltransferase family protein [Chitinophagales bacterium]
MANVELIMPKMGESITEATILKWLKSEGDKVEEDEAVLEIATDKVDSEVPASHAGTIGKILFQEGDVVQVGQAIAIINAEGEASEEETAGVPEPEMSNVSRSSTGETAVTEQKATEKTDNEKQSNNANGRFYSPLVLNIARNENVSMTELEVVPGSGQNNRVTKKDILAYLENRSSEAKESKKEKQVESKPVEPAATPAPQQVPVSTPGAEENVDIIEMDRMRKMIATNMVKSKATSAHVTSFVEADVTKIVLWRNKVKKSFQEREGEKITFTPIFVEAVCQALKEFPNVNASVVGDQIHVKRDLNIGMATALPSGNLIVPVIHKAEQLNLTGITKKVNDLAGRARINKLKPEEIQGGTFTISNVGTFGNLMGTPIISQPQVAVLATGAIKKKPVVIETEMGDTIAIRHMMFLSLSYDHRIVDGYLGGTFLRRIADILEAFDADRSI